MINVNPYLNFMGNTDAAMNFYKSVFGGEFITFQRFKDMPGHERMPQGDWEKVMHASLPMGKGTVLMATDTLESMGQALQFGNNFHISVSAESEEEVDRLFKRLSEGGKTEMPVNKTFWGAYCGMCRDKFGVQWILNYDLSQAASGSKR